MKEENRAAMNKSEHFMSDLRFRLHAEKLHGGKSDPMLIPTWIENQLGFNVKTQVPDDKNYGQIRFGSDTPTATAALNMLKRMCEGDVFANKNDPTGDINWAFTRDKPAWKEHPAQIQNRLVVGRKSGRYFIAIDEKNRPQPVFFFGPSKYHRVQCNGEFVGNDIESAIYAHAWCKTLLEAVPLLTHDNYEAMQTLMSRWDEKKRGGNKGGGGGYNKPQNGGYNSGGNGGSSGTDFNDDIPF
jgi:hypothetical protein